MQKEMAVPSLQSEVKVSIPSGRLKVLSYTILAIVIVLILSAAGFLLYEKIQEKIISKHKIVHGGWGSWNDVSTCSKSCNKGIRYRQRVCNNPSPAYGGNWCSGNITNIQPCNTHPCPDLSSHAETISSGTVEVWTNLMSKQSATTEMVVSHPLQWLTTSLGDYTDCSGLNSRNQISGPYTVYPNGLTQEGASVYCEFTADGIWTVIQKRFDGSVHFFRSWEEYKKGFGDVSGEYWLGNDVIHSLTSQSSYSLKIVLTDWDNVTRYALYDTFAIGSEAEDYRLSIGGYSGNAGDAMWYHNGNRFSTSDRDNDRRENASCAKQSTGCWWYNHCYWSNLNGVYKPQSSPPSNSDIAWSIPKGWHEWGYSYESDNNDDKKE